MTTSLTMDLAIAADAAFTHHTPRTVDHIRIGSRDVRVDVHGVEHRLHTILLLHGVGGLLGDGALMRRAAREFAGMGFRACIPHYFNITGSLFASHASIGEHAAVWREAVQEIALHYSADSEAVGVFGYSLGGFLAAEAAAHEPAIGAVAVMSGGLIADPDQEIVDHLPALLILHGDKDIKVPPEKAEALARLAWHANGFVDTVMYPNEGHSFGSRAERDAFRRAGEFFRARLGAGIYH